jgi:hypothetical protein
MNDMLVEFKITNILIDEELNLQIISLNDFINDFDEIYEHYMEYTIEQFENINLILLIKNRNDLENLLNELMKYIVKIIDKKNMDFIIYEKRPKFRGRKTGVHYRLLLQDDTSDVARFFVGFLITQLSDNPRDYSIKLYLDKVKIKTIDNLISNINDKINSMYTDSSSSFDISIEA